MKNQQRPASGAITVIDDNYGFGSIQAGPPDKPEPARVEPKRLSREEIMRRFGWDDAAWDAALSLGFPSKTHAGSVFGGWGLKNLWLSTVVDRWVLDSRQKAATLRALLGE